MCDAAAVCAIFQCCLACVMLQLHAWYCSIAVYIWRCNCMCDAAAACVILQYSCVCMMLHLIQKFWLSFMQGACLFHDAHSRNRIRLVCVIFWSKRKKVIITPSPDKYFCCMHGLVINIFKHYTAAQCCGNTHYLLLHNAHSTVLQIHDRNRLHWLQQLGRQLLFSLKSLNWPFRRPINLDVIKKHYHILSFLVHLCYNYLNTLSRQCVHMIIKKNIH